MRHVLVAVLLFCGVHASAAVTGRVVDEAGKPLREARVRIRPLETSEEAYLRMLSKEPEAVFLASAETNDSGVFRLDTKGNAVVELRIDAAGRQTAGEDVVDGDDAGTFVLKTAPSRRGRVTAGGRAVAGAVVVIGRSSVTRTDAEGYFEVADPAAGVDRMMVIHPHYAIVDRPIRQRSRDEVTLDVALESGTAIRGRVVDAAGNGVAGATVHASAWPLARTREDGSFDIAHAAVEKPALYAREGARAGSLHIDRAKPPYVIRLRPAARIAGTVRSSKDETPVAGARITVRTDFDESWWPSAISDVKGNFVIDGIEPGGRRLTASHPAYFGGNAPDVRLEEGARVNRIVSVTPYARLAGKVIDEEEDPIAAARIRIVGAGGGTTTAPDGTFSLRFPSVERAQSLWVLKESLPVVTFGPYALEPGEMKSGLLLRIPRGIRFEVRLVDPTGAPIAGEPLALMRRVDPEVRFSRAPVPCGAEGTQCRTDKDGRLTLNIVEGAYDISAGGDTTVRRDLNDQTLNARGSPLTLELERGATIEGRVVWSDGSLAKIRAMITTATPGHALNAPVTDGAFVIRNVPAGKVTLVVDAGPPTFAQSEPREVTAPASGVTLRLPRGGKIEGRVVDRETDRPLREFVVTMQQTRMRGRSIPSKSWRPDDGRFTLEDVAPGTYNLTIHAPGYTRSNTTPVTVEEGKTATAQIALDRGGSVTGRVTGEGRTLADAQILMTYNREMRTGFVPQQTDANGEYTIDGLPPGTHRFEVRRPGFVAKAVQVTVTAAKETRADVDLERGRELRGRVIDTAGRPMAMAGISARAPDGIIPSTTITTDADGSFRLSGLDDTTYTITAQKEGYVETKAEANPATTTSVTLTLSRGGTITGRVLGVPASELQYVQVRAYNVRNQVQPDASGAFTLTGVPDGDVTVAASMDRPRRRNVTGPRVRVINGVAPPVEIDFNAGVAVRGRVTHRGEIFEGYLMFAPVAPSREVQSAHAEIGRDGTYEVRLSMPGEYQVMVSRHGFRGNLSAGRVNVTGDMVHDVDLRGTPVSGVVVDAVTRAPVAGASAMILPGHEVRTNGAGRFTFDLITDGEYKVRAQADGYAPEVRALSVQNSFAPEMELLLARGATAMFRVIDAATGQLAEISGVGITDAAKTPVYYGEPPADPGGVRRVTLLPGTYELHVFGRDVPVTKVTLTVPGPVIEVKVARAPR